MAVAVVTLRTLVQADLVGALVESQDQNAIRRTAATGEWAGRLPAAELEVPAQSVLMVRQVYRYLVVREQARAVQMVVGEPVEWAEVRLEAAREGELEAAAEAGTMAEAVAKLDTPLTTQAAGAVEAAQASLPGPSEAPTLALGGQQHVPATPTMRGMRA